MRDRGSHAALGLAVLLSAAGPAARAQPAAAPAFGTCLADLAAAARAGGVPEEVAAANLLGLAPDPEVVAATGRQPEFVRPVWSYLDAAVTPERVAEGRRQLQDRASTFEAVERRYGVDRHVLAAFWGIESSYGAVLADPGLKPVVRSLASLACGDPGRPGLWRAELTAALRILARGEAPERLTGSWAGAMGHTQFMPSVYEAHAVDFDGDGRRDIWGSVPDALASTAAYLTAIGWEPGQRWGAEAALAEGFDVALADETTERSVAEWRALGARPVRDGALPDGGARGTLLLPAGIRGPAFLLLPNVRAILRYNTALPYALAVAHLSDRLRGDEALSRDWPRGDRALTADERRDLQTLLAARGHAPGAVDGKVGPRTRAAVRAYQAAAGLAPDGYADAALLERLREGR